MRCRTGTHPFRGTNRSRFCEAAYRTMLRIARSTPHRARDTKRWLAMTIAVVVIALSRDSVSSSRMGNTL